jgi:tRNA modification GTPase
VILLVDEISDSVESINKRAAAVRKMIAGSEKRLFIVVNKTDQSNTRRQAELSEAINVEENDTLLFISAKEKTGLEDLRTKLREAIIKEKLNSDDVIITNIRHYEIMLRVSESIGRVLAGLEQKIPDDLIAIDIRQAIRYLGEITGEITSDEILNNIFRNFCIGK